MLRLRIDLTACGIEFKDVFWRLERYDIFHKTVAQYAAQLLQEYGITDVSPLAYLNGTFLPDVESSLIFRDGDLLRILPAEARGIQIVPSYKQVPEKLNHAAANGTITIQSSEDLPESEAVTNGHSQQKDNTGTVTVTAEASENFDGTDYSDQSGQASRKRKRGKRPSRNRSKRVSFDVMSDEIDQGDVANQMESTPFRNRPSNDTTVKASNGILGETRSEAYVTALEDTPGVSNNSKRPMKLASLRKNKKLQSGVGYYLNLLGSGDSSLVAGSSSGDGIASPAKSHLIPGPSSDGDGRCNTESSQEKSEQTESSASCSSSLILSELVPEVRLSCDIGMFNVETSAVENYLSVTLDVLQNNREKRCLIVRHVEGNLPIHVIGTDFKVDWGMLSSIKIL